MIDPNELSTELTAAMAENRPINYDVDELYRHIRSLDCRQRMSPEMELQMDLAVLDCMAEADGNLGPWND